MSVRNFSLGLVGLVAMGLLGFAVWVITLPTATPSTAAPMVPEAETEALMAALAPDRPRRPLIAVLGLNDATETTDYLLPASILRRADVADVVMLATGPGPVQLYPALRALPDQTIAAFDANHPEGADYVIVPAMSRDDDPQVLDWLRAQSAKGATIIGVCAGAKVVAAAGLLDGRRATTHWYYRDAMLRLGADITHVRDRRIVADGRVITTTGITASMPMMLTLIEAIGGRARARAVADDLGIEHWDARHASADFALTRSFATTVLRNRLTLWRHEALGIPLQPGMDEAALALVADSWSRTYRSRALTYAASAEAITTANGPRLLPDRVGTDWPQGDRVPLFPAQGAANALDHTLAAIADRYSDPTRAIVAMQLEYPLPHPGR